MKDSSIDRVAVIGAGLMGFGIGVEFARFGYEVSLYNTSEASSKQAMVNCHEALDLMVETELITTTAAEAAYGRLRPTTDMAAALAGAQYVVESVHDVLTLKQEVMAKIDELCPPSVLVATNTSSLLVTDIAANVKHPERIIATHYYQPPHFVPVVEVMGGEKTDRAYMEKAAEVLRGMNKKVIFLSVEVASYVGNRIQGAIAREIMSLVDRGIATFEQIDDTISFGFGRRMPHTGYFKRVDLIGLDFRYRGSAGRGEPVWGPIKERVERGDLGMKSGKGFYDWSGDKPKQLHRKMNMDLIRLMKQDIEEGAI